ncbi:hypothetical protein CYJ73_00945 [Gordonia terrae]|uniref:NAD(P)-binding domain-containing protein n=1 Tax=Gordonia terrae TaxID=2055 RepID=A0A2I1RDW7_9ACTN|nr:hypothetical protein CYJ73_00945 [Gordonia terrae]
MYTILGATGTVGAQVTTRLLDGGHRVRAVGRSPERLDALARLGADTAVGDTTDPSALAAALRGSSAAFVLQPADYTATDHLASQRTMTESIVRAVRESDVPRVVALSSVGAEIPAGTGFRRSAHPGGGLGGVVRCRGARSACGLVLRQRPLLPSADAERGLDRGLARHRGACSDGRHAGHRRGSGGRAGRTGLGWWTSDE